MKREHLIAALRELQARSYAAEAKADRFADKLRQQERAMGRELLSSEAEVSRVVVLEQEASMLAWELNVLIDDIEADRCPGILYCRRLVSVETVRP